MTTNATHLASLNERTVMYTFTHADTDVVTEHADLKAFKAWAIANLALLEGAPFVHGTSVNDGTREFGKLRYIAPSQRKAAARPADVQGAPTHVQPSTDGPSLDDVLADIDRLELDDAREAGVVDTDADLIDDMDGDGSDFEDEAPVLEGAAARAGIPLLGNDEGQQGSPYSLPVADDVTPRSGRRSRVSVRVASSRAPRMSHKNCGHAITGEAGKIARAACRAEHRASAAA